MKNLLNTFKRQSVTNKLLIVNALFFVMLRVGQFVLEGTSPSGKVYLPFMITADLSELVMKPWSILTHMFVHAEFLHLFFNMLFLFFLGNMFERSFGGKNLLATYLTSGLGGFLLYFIALNIHPALPVKVNALGASAAVMGIFIAYAASFPERKIQLILLGSVALKWLALVYVGIDLIGLGGDNTGGHLGHLGGAAYGLLWATQRKKGRDMNGFMNKIIVFFERIFKTNRSFEVVKRPGPRGKTDEQYNYERSQVTKRIDQILDKISRSGWDSLSKSEKDFLSKHGGNVK
ncbi:MAG: rhomboid family intramembrane serine protease [Flavobacteriales bacterium]|nr:rhomboid family intramembrane serine protease [Flavobacteriales bacterium]